MDVKFGIIGPGNISSHFARTLKTAEGAELVAVASSSSREKAESFAQEFGAKRAYAGYLDLANDPEVDAVYVGLTHNFHYEAVRLCLEHGKAVLCEKPMAVCGKDARGLAGLAKKKDVLLMEAMWTRCLPAFRKAKEWVDEGKIGDVKFVNASFCFKTPFDPEGRLFNPKLAGGCLYDTGVYPIEFTTGILGENPVGVSGYCSVCGTGVDDFAAISMKFGSGALANLSCGFTAETDKDAVIYGTKGRVIVRSFLGTKKSELFDENNRRTGCFEDDAEDGFLYEIRHFTELLKSGKKESDLVPLKDTIACAEIFDGLMEQWKLR